MGSGLRCCSRVQIDLKAHNLDVLISNSKQIKNSQSSSQNSFDIIGDISFESGANELRIAQYQPFYDRQFNQSNQMKQLEPEIALQKCTFYEETSELFKMQDSFPQTKSLNSHEKEECFNYMDMNILNFLGDQDELVRQSTLVTIQSTKNQFPGPKLSHPSHSSPSQVPKIFIGLEKTTKEQSLEILHSRKKFFQMLCPEMISMTQFHQESNSIRSILKKKDDQFSASSKSHVNFNQVEQDQPKRVRFHSFSNKKVVKTKLPHRKGKIGTVKA